MISTDNADPAIQTENNANTKIVFFSNTGVLKIKNKTQLKAAAAYKIKIDNNASITYDSAVGTVLLGSGGEGGWNVQDWQEVE